MIARHSAARAVALALLRHVTAYDREAAIRDALTQAEAARDAELAGALRGVLNERAAWSPVVTTWDGEDGA